jgi:hypothetical protein
MRRTAKLLAAAFALTGALALAPALLAQGALGTLPADLPCKEPLSDSDKAAIRAFVDAQQPGLTGDAESVRKSRNALLQPLAAPCGGKFVQPAFRLEYGRLLGGVVETIAKSDNELHATNALRIAGELATDSTLRLLGDALKSPKPGIRYAACFGLARAFESVARGSPVANAGRLTGAVTAIEQLLAAEADAHVIDGAVLALQAASTVPAATVTGVREQAVGALATGATARASGLKPDGPQAKEIIASLLRAQVACRAAFTDVRNAALPAEVKKKLNTFGNTLQTAAASLATALANAPADAKATMPDAALIDQLRAAGKSLSDLTK